MEQKRFRKRNDKIRRLKEKGHTDADIAAKFGITRRAVSYILRKSRKVQKVKCYCPKCKIQYYHDVEEGDPIWSGRGLWPRYCQRHDWYRSRYTDIDMVCIPENCTERELIERLAVND